VSIEDDERSWQTSDNKTAKNAGKIRQTIHELVDTVGISYEVHQENFAENLNMRRTVTRFVSPTLDKRSKTVACKRMS
jgi:hypothetical protein